MLQRPRDLLTSHDQYSASSVPHLRRFPHHHKQHCPYYKPVGIFQPCHINSFNSEETTWSAIRAKLVSQWEKINHARIQRRIKRSMVKNSTILRNSVTKSQRLGPTSVGDSQDGLATPVACPDRAQASRSLVAEIDSVNGDSKQCLADFDVCTEELNIQNDGYKPGDLSQKKRRLADPMESDRKAGAARRLSHCQLDSEGEGALTPDQYVAIKKKEAVALVMAKFNQWFNKRLEIISYAYEASEASGNPSGGSGSAGSGNDNSGQGQSGRSTRSKRRLGGDDQDGSSTGGDEGDPDRGGSKRAKKEVEVEKKFACPFFKHDPRVHNKHRSCAGPGWTSLHRLKEHLYRAHRLPKHACPRCNEPFEDAKDLGNHLRAEELCKKLDVVSAQGIDETTEAKLKVRKKSCPGMTDEQRWGDIYMILFPKANPNAMPTPYYDSNDALRFSKSVEEWKKTKKRMQKDLPKKVQKKVEKSFEKVEVDVLNRLPDIVRDCLFEFFKDSSHDDRSSSTTTPAATPRAHTPSIPATREQPASVAEETKDTSLDLSYYLEPSMIGGLEEFDFSLFDFGSTADCGFLDKESDSGYASTSTGRGVTVDAEY